MADSDEVKPERDHGTLARNGAYIPLAPPRQKDSLWDKMKSTPYVTVGVFTTIGILCAGVYSMKYRNPLLSNYFMRARVLSQAITIGFIAVATGTLTFGERTVKVHEHSEELIYRGEESDEDVAQMPPMPPKPQQPQSRKVIF